MSEIEQTILSQEQRRCAAMRNNDAQELEILLDQDLHFSHATGGVDDKSIYLAKMAQARIKYLSIDWADQIVSALPGGDVALLTGRMTSLVTVEGVEKRLDNRVLAVWIKRDGQWRLRAFQPTPLPKT